MRDPESNRERQPVRPAQPNARARFPLDAQELNVRCSEDMPVPVMTLFAFG